MQIKTTMRYHLTLVRSAIIKKSTNNKYWKECEEKGTLTLSVGMYIDITTMEDSMEVSLKTKNRTAVWLAIPLLGMYLEKTIIEKKDRCYMHHNIHCSALYNSQGREQLKCPSKEAWIKMCYMFAAEYYSPTKKNEIMPFATT